MGVGFLPFVAVGVGEIVIPAAQLSLPGVPETGLPFRSVGQPEAVVLPLNVIQLLRVSGEVER